MSEESMARLGLAFLFLNAGATIEQAAALAFDDEIFAAITGTEEP